MTDLHPKVSIVVLCYNGLKEVTQPCIASILANTTAGDYELIAVDNASADGTAKWLREMAAKHPQIRPVLNQTNRGYAGGNNDGMRLASGDYIVLLNNDTLVPKGWLHSLLRLLSARSDIGLVGPVTNSAGNEQRIELPGLSEQNFESISTKYAERQHGAWFCTEKLGFFCVAMRRSLPEEIGYLDENFGVGMFEDDDYCIRAKRAGFQLAVVEDCFVYHKGSVSFKKLALAEYRALFDRNRAFFFKKHHTEWALTDLAFSYVDKFSSDLAAFSHRVDAIPPEVERLQVRLENFRHLLVQIYQAELASRNANSAVSGVGGGSSSARRALWHTRKRIFTRMVINGSWRDRFNFSRMALDYARRRLLPSWLSRQAYVRSKTLADLRAIRDQHRSKKVIIFPATVDFHYMEQRPQQLARAFAEAGHLVFYGTLNHRVDNVVSTEMVTESLYLLNENAFPLLSSVFDSECCTYYCLWPNNIKHLQGLPWSKLIYDYMDELSLLDLPADVASQQHDEIMRRADLITVSADQLFEKLPSEVKSKALLVPNAVAESFIHAVDACNATPPELEGLRSSVQVIGYYGAIAEWLDFELVTKLAQAIPDARIILIGPVMDSAGAPIRTLTENYKNVVVLPAKPQIELVPFLKRFNVCIIPFIKNSITDAVSPVKLFEYFAADKPVVTTALRECQKYQPVRIASNHEDFIAKVVDCLGTSGAPSLNGRLIATNNTWCRRVRQINEKLNEKAVSNYELESAQ